MTGLAEYIDAKQGVCFEWGRNDCLSFVSGALGRQGLPELPSEWIGGYETSKGALRHYRRLLTKTGHVNIVDAMDALYDRAVTLYPDDGMIAARPEGGVLGFAFGVVHRGVIVFLIEDGIVEQHVTACDIFWRVS